MLWYRAWLETRSRFLIALFGCVALCLISTIEYRADLAPASRGEAGQLTLVNGVNMALSIAWILSVNLLMMGGLRQENGVGTAAFTLTLPVSRTRLQLARFGMGLIQGAVLAIVPWIGILFAAGLVGKANSGYQALFHVTLLFTGGTFFLALAFLITSLMENQYTAFLVSICVSVMLVYALRDGIASAFNPLTFMMGAGRFQWSTGLLTGQLPLADAVGFCLAGALLVFVAIKAVERLDF